MEPVGSVTAEVPFGWRTDRADTEMRFTDTVKTNLSVGVGDDKLTSEEYIRDATTKVNKTGYQEIRRTGQLLDPVKNKPYAELEYTITTSRGTTHAILRVYGRWALVSLDAPESQFDSVKPIFQHAVDTLTWTS